MASGPGRNRRPVKTGDADAVRDLLGSSSSSSKGDDFDLPPGYENPYEVDRRQRAAERKANATTSPPSAGGSPSSPASTRGARGATGSRSPRPSRSSGSLGVRRAARQASVANPTGGKLPIGLTAGAGAAGLFFGAIAYALLLSVVDYGPSGPLLWFKAKFLNEPAAGASSSGSSSSGGSVAIPPPGTPYRATTPGVAYPVAPAGGAAA